MFESALGRSEASSSRLGTGAVLSGVVHALVAALVFIVPGKTKAQQEPPPQDLVVQILAPKPPAGGPPAAAPPQPKPEAPAPRPKPTAVPIPDKPVPEQVEKPEPPANPDPPPGNDSAANPGDDQGGNTGGGTGGGPGGNGPGTGNGPPEEKPTYTEIPWNSKMERPALISGPAQPEYPRSAMLQHREGTVLARCLIATDGSVRNCSIMSGDVMLQDAALGALARQRYRPLYYGGVPVGVWYVFRFTFKLQ